MNSIENHQKMNGYSYETNAGKEQRIQVLLKTKESLWCEKIFKEEAELNWKQRVFWTLPVIHHLFI